WNRFERRKPTMRVIWILDNGGGAPEQWFDALLPDFRDQVVKTVINEFYTGLRTMVLLAANSDRGLDLADLGVGLGDLANGGGCGDAPMPISVVTAGDLDDVDIPGDVVEIPDEGQSKTEDILAEIDKIFVQLDQDRNGCAWRQFYRRAFDGVAQAGADNAGAVDLTTGITLVLLAARDDDCSQGVFDDGGSFVGVPPSAATLATKHCTETAKPWATEFDAYFGLPPGALSEADLGQIIAGIAWDPLDAIFVNLGAAEEAVPAACDSTRYGDLAANRRLRETLAWIDGSGARTASVDLCDVAAADDLEAPMDEVVDLVREQLPLQACLSLPVAGSKAAYDQDKGEFVPVAPTDSAAEVVAGLARELCRAITVVKDGADTKHSLAIPVDLTECKAGTDSDRRAGCNTDESGWLVRVSQLSTVLGAVTEDAEFICLP
ncbi:MAG TPA: hypothetical protein VM285_11700, partial [Polyangia bacterium]|nr:hypothetical protein [Polyangia bacterium]